MMKKADGQLMMNWIDISTANNNLQYGITVYRVLHTMK